MDDATLIAAIVSPIIAAMVVQFGGMKYALGKIGVKVDRNAADIQRLYRSVNGKDKGR